MTAVAGSLRLPQRYGLARNGALLFLGLPARWHAAKQKSAGHSLVPESLKHAIALSVMLCLLPLAAVGQTVSVVDSAFNSNTITITAGQSVTWLWNGGSGNTALAHNVDSGSSCSSNGLFSSGGTKTSGSYSHQFTVVGTYSYFCDPHCGFMTGSVTVNPAAATHLVMTSVPGSATAGVAFNVVVTAYDQYGNVDTNFPGNVSITGSAGGTLLSGQRTFSVTLFTAGFQSITASAGGVSSSTAFLTVNPAATSQFFITGTPGSTTAGTAFSMTVTAKDPYSNTTPSYGGTVHFTSPGDPAATLPVDYHFVAGDNGVH